MRPDGHVLKIFEMLTNEGYYSIGEQRRTGCQGNCGSRPLRSSSGKGRRKAVSGISEGGVGEKNLDESGGLLYLEECSLKLHSSGRETGRREKTPCRNRGSEQEGF